MKKVICATLLLAIISSHAFAQIKVVEATNITVPPAPSGTVLPVNINNGTIEYNAEVYVVLDAGFEASGTAGSNYFLAQIVPPSSYADLKYELDGSYCGTISGSLYFKYIEKYKEGNLTYQIYDYQRTAMIPVTPPAEFIKSKTLGTNYIKLELYRLPAFVGTTEQDSYYTLEVTNDKGDKFLLRFKYLTSVNN